MASDRRDPTKPWYARPADGFGRVDWVVFALCPRQHEPDNVEGVQGCHPDCHACNCHCRGEGPHLLVENLTEEEARKAAELGSRAELDQFLLALGDRFVWYPHSITRAVELGRTRRVVENRESIDHLTVFPSYAKYRQQTAD